ncbi:hypothetical protein [Kitasatospora sp. DSM 101779]|uniref:hypothetical protein n=1 Tax=Kitasatospora sp. DSM 101779 TaxID=2853165 RepID=UPI0021DB21AE|nr:hypothetical protein [Kitasatospora sp. DSM 101779]MCU7820526.1 hypothetical protein [Kitasatospora sp. DSM 101779]
MAVWIFFFALLLAPVAYGLTREVGTLRRVKAADRLMRLLGGSPGWRTMAPGELWNGYAPHYPWLDVRRGTTVAGPGPDGRAVTVARFVRLEQRRGLHWLLFSFELPARVPVIRLERGWSAAAMGLPIVGPGLYLPMCAAGTEAIAELLERSDLVDRLAALGAPAVSLQRNEACFLFHPLPDPAGVERSVAALAALLPDLCRLARATEEVEAPRAAGGADDHRGPDGARR